MPDNCPVGLDRHANMRRIKGYNSWGAEKRRHFTMAIRGGKFCEEDCGAVMRKCFPAAD